MTARAGMDDLITRLRGMTDSGTAEFTLGAITYWTDDQIQAELDRYREDIYRAPMTSQDEYTNGTAVWHNYYFGVSDVEKRESGTAAWRIENAAGSVVGTGDYTPYYDAGYIRFTADQGGSAYYISCRTYDINRAAAAVYEIKAANVAGRFDIKTDNHDLKRSQLRASYLDMAKSMRRMAKPKSTRMTREDVY